MHVRDIRLFILKELDNVGGALAVDTAVQLLLLGKQAAVADIFDLLREVGQHLFLDPAQGQDAEPLPEEVQLVVGRIAVDCSELTLRSQISRHDQIHH